MRIIIDGRMIRQSGIGRYTRNLITQLQILDKKNEYFILHLKDDYEKLAYRNNFHKVLADFYWYGLNEQVRLPKLLKSLQGDLVHFPHFNVPIFYRGKFVVTIHDLIHQHFSMQRATTHGPLIYKLKQVGYNRVFQSALKRSDKILVPSNFIEKQLRNDWKVNKDKIVVTHEAVDDRITGIVKQIREDYIKKVMKKFNIIPPYLFYVGNAHPHKNIESLINVYLNLKNTYHNLKLVLAGYDHYFWQKIKQQFKDEGIIYTRYISDEELVALYKNAACFVVPSFEEGFGIPILEAMCCACPVISSDAGSLPEVGGDACLYFDPGNPDDMRQKISRLLNDAALRKQLIEKGLSRYKHFSFKKLAQQTLEVYESCV